MKHDGRDDDDRAGRFPEEDPGASDETSAPADTDALAVALLHALSPGELDDEANERLIVAALGPSAARRANDEPAPTRAESRDASALRDALEADPAALALRTDEPARLAHLARALSVAYAPTAIDELRNQALLREALGPRRAQRLAVFAVVLAAAAAFLFFVARPDGEGSGPTQASASLIPSRSTQDLFDPAEPFPREGGTTDRIDKIASSRGRDVRSNRFATWGVR